MNKKNHDRLQSELRQLREIPFPQDLKDSILNQARQMDRPVEKSWRWRRRWKPWFAAVGGVGTAAALLAVVMGHHPQHVSRSFSTAAKPAAYGLQKSGLNVLDVHIGNIPGEPKDSSVIAKVKNTSSHTIGRTDVFGVLAFPRSVAQGKLLNSDSLTFVNGPQTAIPPGKTAKWTFHPVGAPHDASSKGLTEQPYLVFYRSGLKKSAGSVTKKEPGAKGAAAVWNRSGLKVEHASVSLRNKGKIAQSFTVDVKLKNPTGHKVNVTKLWGVVWFGQKNAATKPAWDWSAPGDTRFISSPRANGAQYIAPGQTLEVYFDLVGSSKSDFLNRTPHVAIIQR